MAVRRKSGLLCCGLLVAMFCSTVLAAEPKSTQSRANETPEQHGCGGGTLHVLGMLGYYSVYLVTGGEFKGHMPTINLRQLELKQQ